MANFYPVRLNTIRKDEKLLFDIYIALGDKYVQYIRAQDEFEGERIDKLKSKGVRKLFIPDDQESAYMKYLEKALDKLSDNSDSLESRSQFAHDSLVTSAENAVKNFETAEGMKHQELQMQKISSFVGSNNKVIQQMLSEANLKFDLNHHSANVSSLCMAIGSNLGIKSKQDITELSIAGLVHDIGKQRFKEDFNPLDEKLSSSQRQIYRAHVMDGVSMLDGKPFISPRILGMIAAHEELGRGKGYPEKKDAFKLPLSYQILILANRFDHFCALNKLAPNLAIDPFFTKHAEDFHEDLINSLATAMC